MTVIKHTNRGGSGNHPVDALLQDIPCGGKSEKINKLLSLLCREEGWRLKDLEQVMGFSSSQHRKGKGMCKYGFPPVVRFVSLGEDVNQDSSGGLRFTVGLRRTPELDPASGRVFKWWSQYMGEKAIRTNDVTAFAGFRLRPDDVLIVDIVQASRLMCPDDVSDKSGVLAELNELRNRKSDPGAGDIDLRILNFHDHQVPWAYPDRALVFGPLSLWFAQKLGARKVAFMKADRSHLPERVFEFVNKNDKRAVEVTIEKPL